MITLGFALAAGLSCVAFLAHSFGNVRTAVKPLLDADLAPASKYLMYYCWHIVTITLAVTTAGFAYAAVVEDGADVGLFAGSICAGCLVWSVLMNHWKRLRIRDFPQWIFFIAICAAALWGWFGG